MKIGFIFLSEQIYARKTLKINPCQLWICPNFLSEALLNFTVLPNIYCCSLSSLPLCLCCHVSKRDGHFTYPT